MSNTRAEIVRRFILEHVEDSNIVQKTEKEFGITRQTVNKHLKYLVENNLLEVQGTTRKRHYSLKLLSEKSITLSLNNDLKEDTVWRLELSQNLSHLANNVVDIWHYGFTEMLNNAIEHSDGEKVIITFKQTAVTTEISILDDGEGIFNKLQRAHKLEDERHAILELSKGKLTTDPDNHTGEGIFFASKMFDNFIIFSSGVFFSHSANGNWHVEEKTIEKGTMVLMKLYDNATRTVKEVFDQFASEDQDYSFNKTVVT